MDPGNATDLTEQSHRAPDVADLHLGEEILRQFSFLSFVLSTQDHDDPKSNTQTLGVVAQIGLSVATSKENPFEQDNASDDEYGIGKVHEFGDFGNYFRNKHIKQQKADEEYLRWDKLRNNGVERPQIFANLVFHVNGYTVPSINELHRSMIVHGGVFMSYLTKKSAVTHVICDRLTPRKLVEFKYCKVVRAQWIVDCIEKGKLLDWKEYRTIADIDYAQQRLTFAVNKNEADEETAPVSSPGANIASQTHYQNQDPVLLEDEASKSGEELDDILPLTQSQKDIEEQYGSFFDEDDESDKEANSKDINNGQVEPISLDSSKPSGSRHILDAKHPDFLKNFFANSRLHHLSTWKADLRLKFLRKIVQEKKHLLQTSESLEGDITRVIFHIDFDCFFATASAQNYPNIDMSTTPVAVSHGGKTSDVASCNYVARSFGVKNGMWVGGARKLCPNLVCLGYDFEKYEEYASHLYNYLLSRDDLDTIFPVLIDEVLVDATLICNKEGSCNVEKKVDMLMKTIRREIYELTKCTVSIGASNNVLLAKLALRKSKPDGQYYLNKNIHDFLADISVRSLPGVGRSIESRIIEETNANIPLIRHIRDLSEQRLSAILGKVTGKKIWNYAHGQDATSINFDENNKELLLGRKTVSLDVNYGIRFDKVDEVDKFLLQLAQELYARLVSLRFCGSQLTLKLAIRVPDAPVDPPKYLGMGRCYFITKSSRLGVSTNDWGIIGSELKSLLRIASVQIKDLRGIAVTMSKLEDVEVMKRSRQKTLEFKDLLQTRKKKKTSLPTEYSADVIDWEVFESLPKSLQMEVQAQLKGETKQEVDSVILRSKKLSPAKPGRGVKTYLQQLIPYQQGYLPEYVRVIEKSPTKKIAKQRHSPLPKKQVSSPPSSPNWQNVTYDSSVLQELPSSVRAEVIRDKEYIKKSRKFKHESLKQKLLDKRSILRDVDEIDLAWIGSKPTVNSSPMFLNERVTTRSMKKNISEWISATVDEEGPHPDDVKVFVDYIKEVLNMKDLTRCMIYVRELENSISYESALLKLSSNRSSRDIGVDVWKDTVNEINSLLMQYCRANGISI